MPLDSSWLSSGNPDMFGQKDYDRLLTEGVSAAKILAQLHDNQNYLAENNKRDVPWTETGGLFERIRQVAQSDAPRWEKVHGVDRWDYNLWGGAGFGAKDIEEATAQGASAYQLKQLYDRAGQLGIRRDNPQAQAALANAPVSPWDYGAHGAWGFGLKDIEAMGDDRVRMKEARDWAQQHGLNIGQEVNPRIQELDAEARDQRHLDHISELADAQAARDAEAASLTATFRADTLAQQQAAAAQQQRIQEQMAAQAARVRGSSPTGVGGAASIKGSRLSITQSGGRKGTKRFARPTQYMNTLGMTSGGTGSTRKSPITP